MMDLKEMTKRMVDRIVDEAPDYSLPLLVTKDAIKSSTYHMIDSLDDEQALSLMAFIYLELDKVFAAVTKDWLLEKAGGRKTEMQKVREALQALGIAYF